ncbi:hypothetical protein DES53_104355 [Roseimicrobium gellanilyticum]|uniref:Uncharacterized protein n=1 Tax=Roseimicrobium gellanilyticum TaxID=748857 RepID=A0A366HQQ5_9BACT|nr:hypothetical protein DES53_104355 [Roseimicrobium gellanilyticum]
MQPAAPSSKNTGHRAEHSPAPPGIEAWRFIHAALLRSKRCRVPQGRDFATALHDAKRSIYTNTNAVRHQPPAASAAQGSTYARKSATCAIKSWLMRRYKSLPSASP